MPGTARLFATTSKNNALCMFIRLMVSLSLSAEAVFVSSVKFVSSDLQRIVYFMHGDSLSMAGAIKFQSVVLLLFDFGENLFCSVYTGRMTTIQRRSNYF